MSFVCRVTKLRVLLVLIVGNIIIAVYWLLNPRITPGHDVYSRKSLSFDKSTKHARTTSLTKSQKGHHQAAIQVLHTQELPPTSQEDIFTEFDEEIVGTLYGSDEYIHELRYDRHRGVEEATMANSKFSTVKIQNRKDYYNVDDVIYVLIELQDEFNKRILRGGDQVRIWIKEVSKGACANGYLIDNRNGSYTGVVRLLWPGRVDIVASIAATREAVRVLYTIHRDRYLVRQMFAIFQRRFTYEMSMCAYTPHLPYDRVCNLTEMNYGLPWYCGHPDFLTCQEWTKTGGSQPPWPMYKEDRTLFETPYAHQNFPRTPRVKVLGHVNHQKDRTHLIPCNEVPPGDTWEQTTPVGYFLNWKWRSTICRNTLPNTVESWNKCLSNRRVWMHGDSTLRQWFSYFRRRQEAELVSEKWSYAQWPYPSTLYKKDYNYAIYWATHELPFTNTEEFVLRLAHKATHVYIDELPSNNRDIVIIHLYLHFSAYPPTVLQTHLRRIAKSVKSLLQRSPSSKVFLKGPHAFHDYNNRGVIDDYWGNVYSKIYKQELKELHNRVYYLDYWDMTVAAESDDVHPNATLFEAQIQYLLGFICP